LLFFVGSKEKLQSFGGLETPDEGAIAHRSQGAAVHQGPITPEIARLLASRLRLAGDTMPAGEGGQR